MKYKQLFLGQNDNPIVAGVPDNFSRYFDWITLPLNSNVLNIYKNSEVPKTVYLKTDFLPAFVNSVLPKIENEFILITCCSDYSPEVNFNVQYRILMNHPKLKFWFMANMRNKNEKSFSLPVGLSSYNFGGKPNCYDPLDVEEVENYLLKIRNNQTPKIDKVFCSFRKNRYRNDCGQDMVIRPAIMDIVSKNPEIFDIFEPDSLPFYKFVETLSQYKYALCPHGNGMDPSPTCWISLIVNTIPVIYKTPNVMDMFEGTDSVIYFDKFEQIANKNLYSEKKPIDFEFLTCEYWAKKIKSKI